MSNTPSMPAHTMLSIPPPLARLPTSIPSASTSTSFLIGHSKKTYKHQYSNIYFIRLRILRDFVEERARRRWENIAGKPFLVHRVLDVKKSKLCYVVGTVYMDMPLKPNVMEDIARDHSIAPPPPPSKFYSPDDNVMLEDESGRICLVGDPLKEARLVTGVIIGALGMETPDGDFEIVDICYAGMVPQSLPDVGQLQEDSMDVDVQNNAVSSDTADEWIAVISGLDVGSDSPSDGQIQMLTEYLTGEVGGVDDHVSASQISRLIIAGDSLAPVTLGLPETIVTTEDKKARRYGYDAATFTPHPILSLSATLHDIASSMPVHILPGERDPSGIILPQQPFPRAMFGEVSRLSTFICETNPTYLSISSDVDDAGENSRQSFTRTLLINSGQPLNDMFKYLPTPPNTRLSILESTLRWRHMAPTAPDTLWCHPYFTEDPFLMTETPDLYIVGGQKKFGTKMVTQTLGEGKQKDKISSRCRIIMVPSFSRTGILVLVNLRSLAVKCVNFSVVGMTGGGEDAVQRSDQPDPLSAPSPSPIEPLSSASNLNESPQFM